ncbi:MAG: class I SAM-dependent methyltransferase [Planctomycetia bacterium]|nr:class I SAM-dependent methyltransferase [Planctomycetia bacterium]
MNSAADLDDYRWLVSPAAAEYLAEMSAQALPLHRAVETLRRRLTPARAHLVLEQVELRQRARKKFAAAERMFFTPRGLEQSTDQWVAAYKALRFDTLDQGAVRSVADLCCGIGGDLIALGRGGRRAIGVDLDPIAATLAHANLDACGVSGELQIADVTALDIRQFAAWHIDPDRRPQGRRTSHVEVGQPSAEALTDLLDRSGELGRVAMKLAPGADVPDDWTARAEREWISRDRHCRQQVAWFGPLANRSGERRATALTADGTVFGSICGQPDVPLAIASQIARYVLEPNPAVLAAHLTGELARLGQLEAVGRDTEYLTADAPHESPLVTCFEVLEVLPLDLRQVRAALKQRRVGTLEVKKRGVDLEPAKVLRRLRPVGEESATLLLTPTPAGPRAIIARRHGGSSGAELAGRRTRRSGSGG